MQRGFIFDMDGVLVDSEPLSDLFTIDLIKKLGKDPSSIDLERLRGFSAKPFYSLLIKELKLDISLEDLMAEAQPAYMSFFKSVREFVPVPGVVDFIKRLKNLGIKLAVGSSAHRERFNLFLDRLNLGEFFPVRISGDDIKNPKPAPDVFLLAAERIHVSHSQCIVIEDSVPGITAAKAASMKCIGFAGLPYNKQDLSSADIIIKDFSEITNEVLEKLYG